MASLLLSVSALALVATTRGTLALSDDSQLIAHAEAKVLELLCEEII